MLIVLIQQWLENAKRTQTSTAPLIRTRSITNSSLLSEDGISGHLQRHSYQVINSERLILYFVDEVLIISLDLLRVIRKGPTVKSTVDDAIDQCSEVFNLRDAIEVARVNAEQTSDAWKRQEFASKGIINTLVS